MKAFIIHFLTICLFVSCSNINRDKPVDRSKLTGDDYRLFQNTPAWELARAVMNEDERKITELISNDPNLINYQEPKYGNTLLKLTVMNQQIKPFRILLANKADVNIHNNYNGTSALIESCLSKQYTIKFTELLLKNGANVNDIETGERRKGNTTRLTPLMAAARTGKLDLVELLIKNGANINYQNEYKHNALNQAIMQNNYAIALYLLEKGADYTQPIFYREDERVDMYLVDVLREDPVDLYTDQHKYKMQIVDFLKSRGIDYRSSPIPDHIRKQAQENHPDNWQEYLEKY